MSCHTRQKRDAFLLTTPTSQQQRRIQQLRGDAADSRPIAELWYGAHPSGPSVIDGERTLADVIAQD
ncbi:type I phosphomannose isomerase catalytic subunit, partial [Corynebacterium diphtheriae]|uniref:type I phosphomannose isomerase catalytic subunit n=1 Tax=Corynebacterium diphtheriae TaxID=1717 RepID=UPI00390B0065